MDWHRSADEKPTSNTAVLGFWPVSRSYLMVVYLSSRKQWFATTGGEVSQPIAWAIPAPPEITADGGILVQEAVRRTDQSPDQRADHPSQSKTSRTAR